jgi:tetratricopeptide (TPR) repeat protein
MILNKVTGQWGAYTYDAANDVARVQTKPVTLSAPVETFTISLDDLTDGSGVTLSLLWEKTRASVRIDTDVIGSLVPQIESALASPGEKAPYAQAAMFYLENNLDLKKALTWMDAAIAANPKAFYLVYRKALILEKMGDKAGAIATSEASLAEAEKATGAIKDEYIRLNKALLARLR